MITVNDENHRRIMAGRVFPGYNGATVILVHGYGGHQDEMLLWPTWRFRNALTCSPGTPEVVGAAAAE